MKFLIQDSLLSENLLAKAREAAVNFPHEFIGVIPFSHEITSTNPIEGIEYIPYGSTLFIKMSQEKGYKGLYFDMNTFNYKASLENRDDMLNPGHIVSVSDALEILQQNTKKDWFTRPSHDLKHYTGTVLSAQEIHDWFIDAMKCDSSGSYKMEPEMEILLAEPKNIKAEWRWFVVDRKIVSGSLYRRNNQLVKKRETDPEMIKIAQQKADGWLPSECCVLDIALVGDEYKVIEFNCINGSGFYDNDSNLIFEKLFQYASRP